METAEKQTSSLCEEPQYDAATRTLTITFKKGGVYDYPDFSLANFDEFHDSPSWGKFFHGNRALFVNGVRINSPAEDVKPS